VSQDTLDEIDKGVEEAGKEADARNKLQDDDPDSDKDKEESTTEEDLPDGDKKPDEEEGDDDKPDADDEKSGVSDDLVERAVRAGMKMADAISFQDAEALDRVVSMLESKEKKEGDEKADEESSTEAEELLSKIPDLDPEAYDEGLVAVVQSMKAMIISQDEAIKGLRSESVSRSAAWFDGHVDGLGEDYSKALTDTPQKRDALKSTFDALSAGYKANGKDVRQEVVFNEALSVVLGDVVAKAKATVTSEKLSKRSKRQIARPVPAKSTPKKDVDKEVADEIDEKYAKDT
jgi:hypothetical protein